MAWVKTTEDPDRYINSDLVVWVHVEQNGSNWDIVLYPQGGGQFTIATYGSKFLAETALAALVLTF